MLDRAAPSEPDSIASRRRTHERVHRPVADRARHPVDDAELGDQLGGGGGVVGQVLDEVLLLGGSTTATPA